MADDDVKPYQIRLSTAFWAKVDGWRRQQAEIPARAEAIRRLVDLGLAAEHQRRKAKQKGDT